MLAVPALVPRPILLVPRRVLVRDVRLGIDDELPLDAGDRPEVVVARPELSVRIIPLAVLVLHPLHDPRVGRADACLRPLIEVVERREGPHEGPVHDELAVDVLLHRSRRPSRLRRPSRSGRRAGRRRAELGQLGLHDAAHGGGEESQGLGQVAGGCVLEALERVREGAGAEAL